MNRKSPEPGLLGRLYRNLSPVLCGFLPLAAPLSAKLAEGIEGRRGLMARLLGAAGRLRGCVWFHVSSVGEYEQARPLIQALRDGPECPPIVVTHFSPSGYRYARKRPCADFHDYLPFDDPQDMARLVAAWDPRLLVFVKFDCWPNLVYAASRRNVPVLLMAGSLQPRSVRLKPAARPLFRDLFDRFAHVGVCTPEDRTRFVDDLGTTCPVSVTGDTRVEQVILRYEEAHGGPTAAALRTRSGSTLVLGSTWPADEKLWLPVLPELVRRVPGMQVILTPHEPLPHRLAALERSLADAGLESARLSAIQADPGAVPAAPVVLTDSIGVLAEIYRAGDLAYVGGSFTTGVHNTMEPAVAGLPVLFGPEIRNAEEAGELVRRGAGFVLERPEQALERATALLTDRVLLHKAGAIARQVVLDQRGATERSMAVIRPHLQLTGTHSTRRAK